MGEMGARAKNNTNDIFQQCRGQGQGQGQKYQGQGQGQNINNTS